MDKVSLIKKHEGYRDKLYQCTAGKMTIGYGRNIEDRGISKDEAALMLANDIAECEETLKNKLDFFNELSVVRRAILVNMMFNLGWPRLSGFKNMISAIESKDYSRASAEMLDSRWARQVGNRAIELSEMMSSDKWP